MSIRISPAKDRICYFPSSGELIVGARAQPEGMCPSIEVVYPPHLLSAIAEVSCNMARSGSLPVIYIFRISGKGHYVGTCFRFKRPTQELLERIGLTKKEIKDIPLERVEFVFAAGTIIESELTSFFKRFKERRVFFLLLRGPDPNSDPLIFFQCPEFKDYAPEEDIIMI